MAQPSNAWLREFAKFMSLANDPSLAKSLKAAAKETNEAAERLEKAKGGVRKLEQADKVLADAHKDANTIKVIELEAAERRHLAAEKVRKAETEALDERKRELDTGQTDLDALRTSLEKKSEQTEIAVLALQGRVNAADARDQGLSNRESAVSTRETRVTAREAEIKRFDAWRATAPA